MSVKEVKSVYEGGLYRVILSFTEKKNILFSKIPRMTDEILNVTKHILENK